MKFTKLEKDILTAVAGGKSKDDILAEKITTLKCLLNTLTNIYKKTAELVQYKTERNKFEELQKYLKENSVLPFLIENQPEISATTETRENNEAETEPTEDVKEEEQTTLAELVQEELHNKCMDCEKDILLKYSDLQIEYDKLENYSKILEKCLDAKEELNEYLRTENETLKNKLRN